MNGPFLFNDPRTLVPGARFAPPRPQPHQRPGTCSVPGEGGHAGLASVVTWMWEWRQNRWDVGLLEENSVFSQDGLTGWFNGWLTYCLDGWLTGWMADSLTGWMADSLTGGIAESLTGWMADSLTVSMADWLNDLLDLWLADYLDGWRIDWLDRWLTHWVANVLNISGLNSVDIPVYSGLRLTLMPLNQHFFVRL